ncbi:DNA adenine methylase [Spiroplasma gladiatoris]|uniref:site-specific DNA-methyltransferase (adenine-specific) n=1 Tax=Spiroplasma gladiatoris TaxID=2143 RepID=A0A4P7AH90_9MOLU|nr:DNA adenine methylase [Spiroplasma gladiatoris]QBQ07814.1 DNA adenine methylase [Spiroplasma gladiatoris]
MKKYYKSPINYLGNKYRILDSIFNNMPVLNKKKNFIDVFTGSGTVAINSDFENLYVNDFCQNMIDFLNFFYKNNYESIIDKIEKVLIDFKLPFGDKTTYNKSSVSLYSKNYYKLRESYNNDKNLTKLLCLIFYSFNNQIRFNSKGFYNIPIGKSVFNHLVKEKIKYFNETLKVKNLFTYSYKFIDFIDKILEKNFNSNETFFYFDPPYLITNATYNANWNEIEENKLLNKISELNSKGYKFILSNVLQSNGKTNIILLDWVKKNNFKVINVDVNYNNSNYHRKNKDITREVIILNY